ncbi:MAG: glycosyltransferase family 4 protein [Caldilineaceae bacterium]|nr:glycosyltransferase family 4 protein [Caldilineaceae bacterium]
MRVVMVSKALVVGAYQRKAEEIARLGIDLTVLTPPAWGDRRGRNTAAPRHVEGYDFRTIPIRFANNFHLHHYPTLGDELTRLRPHVLHMDEEPYNTATWQGLRLAHRLGIAGTFFTWQNLLRRYPPPFRQMEASNYRRAAMAMAGSEDAAAVLRAKGYTGGISVIPQFGVDPDVFSPGQTPRPPGPLIIGYAGGLLPEKGVDLLLRACAGLAGEWRLRIAGEGGERANLVELAAQLGIAAQCAFLGRFDSGQMADFLRTLDVLVLPSRTTPSWKEQFGRVLIEAMACGVPVIGSDSGEIPVVIGQGGLIFPEESVADLRACLQSLMDNPNLRRTIGARGRNRVLEHYTMAAIARSTVNLYSALCASPSTPNS